MPRLDPIELAIEVVKGLLLIAVFYGLVLLAWAAFEADEPITEQEWLESLQ